MTEFEKKLNEELEKQIRETQKPNLVVVGGTGVGKSSLINRIFGKQMAEVGNGQPITHGMNRYEWTSLVFFDTEGYELGTSNTPNKTNFDQNIVPEILKMNKGELKDQIHLVWYCISISNHRVLDYDLQNIEFFVKHNMKTAVVFTQCDTDEELPSGEGKDASEFRKIIQSLISSDIQCFETCALNEKLELDLPKLVDWSCESLPNDQLRRSFVEAQKCSISRKKKEAYLIVTTAVVTTAATGGFNPIPLSDSLLIAPQQIVMCVSICRIFFGSVSGMLKEIITSQVLSLAGKTLAASLVKLIPGFGQIINAAVAGTLTLATGAAITEVNAKAYKEYLDTGKLPDWAQLLNSPMFMDMFKNVYNRKKWEEEK